jgi:GTP cyclohydrolase I
MCNHFKLPINITFTRDDNKEKLVILKKLLKSGNRIIWFDYGVSCDQKSIQNIVRRFDGYDGIIIERNIPLTSMCSHHHQTIRGVVHIGYVAGAEGRVIGLSKLNRIVEHFGRRGAIQEQLTAAIHQGVDKVCEGNLGVIVTVVATHNCVSCRGIKHSGAAMVTTKATGVFRDDSNQARKEFFDSLKINNGGHQI